MKSTRYFTMLVMLLACMITIPMVWVGLISLKLAYMLIQQRQMVRQKV